MVPILFSCDLQKLDEISNEKLYQVKKLTIDSNDFTKDIRKKLTNPKDTSNESNDAYCIKFDATWNVQVKNQCDIFMETESIVPLDDICFSNKITMPCKRYEITFILKDPNYSLSWHNFGFLGNHKDRIIEEPAKAGLVVGFKDWILPGDGVVITINKVK